MIDKQIRQKLLSAVISFAETMIITMFAVSLIFTYIVRVTIVNGESMMNTLMPEDRIVMTTWYNTPRQGDIVVINATESVTIGENGELVTGKGMRHNIVKRIIATEGQSVDFDFEKGIVFVNGKALNEPYILGFTHRDEGAFTGKYPVTVPDGYVFVLGDNRINSRDSRSDELGFVDVDNIIGKIILRIFPLDSIGFVE